MFFKNFRRENPKATKIALASLALALTATGCGALAIAFHVTALGWASCLTGSAACPTASRAIMATNTAPKPNTPNTQST
jgi:hypothetical protein